MKFPYGTEWWGSGDAGVCIRDHYAGDDPSAWGQDETCPGCVSRKLWLPEIRRRGLSDEVFDAVWACADAYGEPGTVPPQGHDWSGIRDSSPGAIRDMAEVLELPVPTTA